MKIRAAEVFPTALAVLLLMIHINSHADERRLEEIIVSAEKVEQSVQDTAISISVVGKEELSRLNIFDFTETAALTPGVDMTPGGQSAAIRLRGIGPGSFALTAPQSVAVFVDEFAQISISTVFSTLVDIERIELLRGPQGTLYGLNAPGGVYNIVTRSPNTEKLEGYIESSYSQYDRFGYETYDLRGALNIPLVEDKLGLRVTGVYADSEGFVKVVNPVAGEDSTGGKNHKSFRSRLLWLVSPDMDLLWSFARNRTSDNPVDPFNPSGLVPGTEDAPIINQLDDNFYYGDFISEAEGELIETNVHWRWAAGFSNIDFLAAYQDTDSHLVDNRDPYPGKLSSFDIELLAEQVSAELRFSDGGELLDYVAGLYYADRELTDGNFDLRVAQDRLLGPAVGDSISKAVFANLTFHLSEKWDLTTGARYDENDVSTFSDFTFAGLRSFVDDDLKFDHVSWSFKLRNYITENHTAYLAIDNAYKQGGFNNLTPAAVPIAPFIPGVDGLQEAVAEMQVFDEETSTSFEIGIKGVLLDNRMNYSAAVFYQVYDDHQITQANTEALKTPFGDLNALFLNQLVNVDEVTSAGIEAELAFLIGERWDVTTRVAYFDPQIDDWQLRFCPGGEEQSDSQLVCPAGDGKPLNNSANWQSIVQLGYGRPVLSSWFFYSNMNWSWNAEPTTSDTRLKYDPYHRLGITLGLKSLKSGLDIRLWGKDLTEEGDFNATLKDGLDETLEDNAFQGSYRSGREYGLTMSYEFGPLN
jgi:iron complex outermembrane recepter protein